jgi:hypothetical protein
MRMRRDHKCLLVQRGGVYLAAAGCDPIVAFNPARCLFQSSRKPWARNARSRLFQKPEERLPPPVLEQLRALMEKPETSD